MEEITKSVPILITVKQRCDQCKEGYMEEMDSKITLLTYPPQYPHKCNKCGYTQNYIKAYPYSEVVSEEEYKRMINDNESQSKKCEYCDSKSDKCKVFKNLISQEYYLDIETFQWEDEIDDYMHVTETVLYCPYCGRKLNNDL